ncbi:MAG: glutamine synthetase, partial [Chloroflexi bacterium]|nr:glutamine synthetase [Chloroflexota bacterium]
MQVADVEKLIAEQEIEVVQVGGADMDGVFRGKRILSEYFLDGCRGDGFPQCSVIFGWDIAEELISGLALGSAETGYGDIIMQPDLSTFRAVPWEAGCASI